MPADTVYAAPLFARKKPNAIGAPVAEKSGCCEGSGNVPSDGLAVTCTRLKSRAESWGTRHGPD